MGGFPYTRGVGVGFQKITIHLWKLVIHRCDSIDNTHKGVIGVGRCYKLCIFVVKHYK
jgi:hypothetical protein